MNKLTKEAFLEFVEIKTKIASQIPFVIGLLWTVKQYHTLNVLNTMLFFCAILLFDMATTAINNTVDYAKAVDLHYQQTENVIGKFDLPFRKMVWLTIGLLCSSLVFSFILATRVDAMIFILGGLCMLIGIGYTFGPMPLSRLPLGEIFSGVTMGAGIFYLTVYINQPNELLTSIWSKDMLTIFFHWSNSFEILMHSLPLVCLIANIMLANNICDLEQDIANQRHTLVYYIGVKRGLILFNSLATIPWLAFVYWVLSGFYTWWTLGILLIGIGVYYRAVKRFNHVQIKAQTFSVSLKCFMIYSLLWAHVLMIEIVIYSSK